MTIARATRLLLGLMAACVVVWSFYDVTRRSIAAHESRRARPITLTVLHWGNPGEDHIVDGLCKRYEAEHPLVQIQRINAGADDFRSKLKTMLAAGTPPDVFYLPPDELAELAQLKLIRPLDDLLARDPSSVEQLKGYFPILIDAFRYDIQKQRAGEGPLYGLPKDFTTSAFYVNVDLFNAAGIPVPYKGWTWDEFSSDMRKITDLRNRPEFKDRQIFGGFFQLWADTLRQMVWSFGGEFFGPGGFRDVALDQPGAQAALDFICKLRLTDKTVFNPTGIAKDGGQEFINGNIGCIGPIGTWMVPTYKDIKAFKWDVVPVPYANPEFQSSQIFLTAWTMSTGTKNPDECLSLIKFLCGKDGATMQARLQLAIPPLRAVANSDNFLHPGGDIPPYHSHIFLDAIPHARLQQNPPEPEWDRIIGDRITKSIQLGEISPMDNAKEIKQAWLDELDSPLRRRQWAPMRWNTIVTITAGVLATIVAVLWWRARREKVGPLDAAQQRAGWAFISPWLFGFAALTLGPMVVSLLLSFSKWTGMTTMGDAESVGLANYSQLLRADPTFYKSLRVTMYFVILAVPVTQVAALAVALLMNTKVRGITIFRTIYFVPSVVSGVALAVLWLQIFNNDYGLLNKFLRPIVSVVGALPPDWFGKDARHWAIPAFVIMGLWGVGGGMIIYLAGLKGIPASLYEAATIDGAGPVRKLWNVTLPMLSPLIFYNLVMGIIGSFQVFTQAFVMTGAGPDNSTLFYVLSLYRQAFEFHNMGYASAMAWVLFVMVLALTVLMFRGSKSLVYYEGLKS